MYSQATTYVLDGLRPRQVKVDTYITAGAPRFAISGLSHPAEMPLHALVRSAIASCGFSFPENRRVSVRVSAAEGAQDIEAALALPIALAILAAFGQIATDMLRGLAVAGNLLEDGSIGAVRGALQMAEAVAEDPRLDSFAVASESASEAACASGVEVLQLYSLAAARYISDADRERLHPSTLALPSAPDPEGANFSDLRDLGAARRACEVAAAGDHSLLLLAPGGEAQNALARRVGSILPPLRCPEALEVLRIQSSVRAASPATARPFRSPSAKTAPALMLGSGSPVQLGEVTLAHNGVLYLEEVMDHDAEILRAIHTARAGGRAIVGSPPVALPASFFLLASAEPCPCGEVPCTCEEPALRRHFDRLGPAAAEFDLIVPLRSSSQGERGEPSCAIRARVSKARAAQAARLGEGRVNRQMSIPEAEECGLGTAAAEALNRALPYPDQLGRRIRVARVARTVADLAGAEEIDSFHLAEAIDLALHPCPERRGDRPMDPGNSPGIDTAP